MIVKGYINIQQSPKGFYTGADIHETEELAKAHASKLTVCQVYIAFDTECQKRTRDMTRYYAEKELEEERIQERIGSKIKRKYTKRTKESKED